MRPAFSLIIFTSLSGLGLGLAAIMGLGLLAAPSSGWWLLQNMLALGLVGAGIVSSTFHLGHPERAWRALSQWRSSWLSREGVLAALTMLALACWMVDGWYHGVDRPWLGGVITLLALATIWSTAMIYASLKTVARWHHPLTGFVFLGYGLSGALLLAATLDHMVLGGAGSLAMPAGISVVLATAVSLLWSYQTDAASSGSTPESATGLGRFGPVRMLMPPHSEENWLQHEMGFKVARRHTKVLRRISLGLTAAIPLLLLLAMPSSLPALCLASLSHLAGVMISRWLFFAEAKHTVTLYYGDRH